MTRRRWVLAYNADCRRCRAIASVVTDTCEEVVQLLPLSDPEIASWRQQTRLSKTEWVPTLFAVSETRVRAWTRSSLAIALAVRLGPRRVVRLLNALSEVQVSGTPGGSRLVVGLREAFRLARAPAVPGDDSATAQARAWIAANRGHLPQTYADIIAFAVVYRRLFFAELSPIAKGAFWQDHLDAYVAERAGELSPQQTTALKRARAVLSDPAAFAEPRSEATRCRMETTQAELRASFDDNEMRDIFGIFRAA